MLQVNNEPLSLAKAKRERLRMAKFPLDKYLQWGEGSGKSLTLNQCLLILLDMKKTGDWKYALRHVPRRKLAESSIHRNIDNASEGLRYDKRLRDFQRIWKPTFSLEQKEANRRSTGEKQSMGKIDVHNIMRNK